MKPRPLSPHLQIYRPQMSSVISILHRIAGVVLVGGLLFLLCWLHALGADAATYDNLIALATTDIGKIATLGLAFAYFFYFFAEIRYLCWSFGKGFSLPVMNRTGWAVVLFSALATAFIWSLA